MFIIGEEQKAEPLCWLCLLFNNRKLCKVEEACRENFQLPPHEISRALTLEHFISVTPVTFHFGNLPYRHAEEEKDIHARNQ